MDSTNAPEWYEGLKWIFAALLLAAAFVGPQILGPIITRMKARLPPQQPIHPTVNPQLAVIGGALADKDAVYALVAVLERIATMMEEQLQHHKEETEEAHMRCRIREAMEELAKKNPHTVVPRD